MRIEQLAIPALRAVMNRPRLAEALFRFDRWGNPLADDVVRDPYPLIERMRADGPVVHRAMYQQWFVLGYDEARQVLSSDASIVGNQSDTLLAVRPYTSLNPRAQRFFKNWLLLVDPPDHTRLRRLVSRAFTPARVRELEPSVEKLVDELITAMGGTGPIDVVATFNEPLPVNVIGTLLGLPRERWAWLRRTTAHIIQLLDPFTGFDPAAMNATIDEVFDYYGDLAEKRRSDPAPDVICALAAAEEDGDRLSSEELVAMIFFLMGAGHETTTNLLGTAIVALARNPEQRAMVRESPDRWPNAVEELIRYDTSVQVDPRATARSVELGGVTIPAGQNVIVNIAAANRDPRRFDRPNELVLDREDPAPLSFGHGIHHCLGAALARMELRLGLRAFVDAFGDYTIDESAIVWKRSLVLRGPKYLPVTPG